MSNNNTLRPPPRPRSPGNRAASIVSHRSTSSLSNASVDSHVGELAIHKRHPYATAGRPATAGGPSASSASLQNFSRPTPRGSIDSGMRIQSPPLTGAHLGHRSRQHSQGFFEPSLPHASTSNVNSLASLSASQIAAQTAMHHVQAAQQERKRSGGGLAPATAAPGQIARRVPSPIYVAPVGATNAGNPGNLSYSNGTVGGRNLAATTAANVVFPRSPLHSPHPQATEHHFQPPPTSDSRQQTAMAPPPPQEAKTKERSKMNMNMKLFSKPKGIGISTKDKDKDNDKKNPALPSPVRGVLRSGFSNMSTTSLADPVSTSASSLYSSANVSTSTLTPTTATTPGLNPDKDKHRHTHFLSRQKQKLKESAEHRSLPLSSASSNSQAVDPSAPQSLYSFAPASPGFSKSVSGLDLRHGGRALREKKKEEKAAAAASVLTPIISNSSANVSRYDDARSEFIGPSSLDSGSVLSPPTTVASSVFSFPSLEQAPTLSAIAFNNLGNTMGLTGMTPDDSWPLLKARLLNIFEGEDLRTPIEDFNLLASVHVRRCIQKRVPIVLVEDLRELLQTGFSSLAQTLRGVPDGRLVSKLVEMWITVFGTILPFIQAVFLPLDLEFKGQGSIMTPREAAEFWGAFIPEDSSKVDERPSSSGGTVKLPSLGEELDVRRITLIVFRDVVILPKHESLMAIFSRLSLDSIKTSPSPGPTSPTSDFSARNRGLSNPATTGAERPSTGGSLSPRLSSFNSQASTLLDAASSSSGGNQSQTQGRSRAASNTSAGSFGTSLPHLPSPLSQPPLPIPDFFPTSAPPQQPSAPVPIADPAKVTETVARMLQCVSVLAGVQTGDAGQAVVERLTQALKYNWLGRGRTGRQRRGWVGMKVGVANGRPAGIVGA